MAAPNNLPTPILPSHPALLHIDLTRGNASSGDRLSRCEVDLTGGDVSSGEHVIEVD